jgi:hypothetical protein
MFLHTSDIWLQSKFMTLVVVVVDVEAGAATAAVVMATMAPQKMKQTMISCLGCCPSCERSIIEEFCCFGGADADNGGLVGEF